MSAKKASKTRRTKPLMAVAPASPCSPLRVRELSLRPYHGRLFVAPTTAAYERAHQRIFKTPDVLNCGQEGRFSGGEGNDGMWTYLVWAEKPHTLAHELSHVVLHVFERCKIDPREGNGEPFCYMLSQLILEANAHVLAPAGEKTPTTKTDV